MEWDIPNATSNILTINNVLISDAGNYTCLITGPQNEQLTSQTAVLTVNDCMTSILDVIDARLVQLFPNPTTGIITLQISELEEDYDLQFYNLQGQLLRNVHLVLDGTGYSQDFDLTTFAKGIYLIRLVNAERALVKRVVLR